VIEVYKNLFIGSEDDYEDDIRLQTGWQVVHACKEPYHRRALGYTSLAAPKDHPEYWLARRENRLILNLIDAQDPAYIPKFVIDAAVAYIHEQLDAEARVFVHCNQGISRSPSIGLLYLVKHTDALPTASFAEAEPAFRTLYPPYRPTEGIRGFIEQNWHAYL
jgi:predicted protein tyrosine phosphatase